MSERKQQTEFRPAAGLSHAAIRTRSITDSIRYYTEVLGLREAFRMYGEDGSLVTVYLFLAPGQYLELFSGGSREGITGPDVTGFCHLCLMTKDIRESYEAVRQAGGPLDSEIRTGKSRCLMFWTHDPDGTQIEVMEMPPESLQAQADRRLEGACGFRPMRRSGQQISAEECTRILREEKRGILSMHGENGYPYSIPMNHWYDPEDGKLYFHGAKTGHKIDAIRTDNRVSYCVHDAGWQKEGEWALNIRSVVAFGRISLVRDEEKAREICTRLCRKFTEDEEYIRKELESALPRVQCLELTIDHMTGKLVNES